MSDTNSPDEKQAPSEIMARAGFRDNHQRQGLPANAVAWRVTQAGWESATRAMIAALAEAGYKIVAREPSEAMLTAADRAIVPDDNTEVWRAMWDAAE